MSRWRRRWHRRVKRHWMCVGLEYDGRPYWFDARTIGAKTLKWVREWMERHGP